jgi:hypothetical protein
MQRRRIAVIVLFFGVMFAGYFGVTRASKQDQDQIPRRGGQEQGRVLADQDSIRAEQERSDLGLAMAPVPLRAGFGRTRFLIGLGSYLVNTGCVGCHTNPTFAPGGNPFLGQPERINATNYLAGGAQFGPFTSRNLTPDPQRNNLPAGLLLADFIRTMRTGQDLKNLHPQFGPLLQVMPWPEFSGYSDRDLEAMYLYLSVIPHADPVPAQ